MDPSGGGLGRGMGRGALMETLRKKAMAQAAAEAAGPLTPPLTPPVQPQPPQPEPSQPPQIPTRSIPAQLPTRSIPAQLPTRSIPPQLPTRSIPAQLPTRSIPAQLPTRSIPQLPTRSIPPQIPTRSLPGPPQVVPLPTRSIPTRSVPTPQPAQIPTASSAPVPQSPQTPTTETPQSHVSPTGLPAPGILHSAPQIPTRTVPQAPTTADHQQVIGRANVLETMLRQPPPPEAHQPGVLHSGRGRAALLSNLSIPPGKAPASLPPPAEPVPKPSGTSFVVAPPSSIVTPSTVTAQLSDDGLGVTGSLANLGLNTSSGSDPSAPTSRMGTTGTPLNIMSNYLGLRFHENKGIYRYETRFEPETDSPRIRNALLNQHLELLGKCKIFDGVLLYISTRLDEAKTTLKSVRHDGEEVTIKLIFQKKQKASESVQFFNILLGKVMKCLEMVRINRNNFNPNCAHKIEQHKMELWPGYITAIEEVEGGLMLNIDASHRVMRTDTVRNFMADIHKQGRGNFRDLCTTELLGVTVLTRYNNSTYRIDDIHWDKDPSYQFEAKGKMISLAEYYKAHWNINIQDMKQPLLYHKAKKRGTQGTTIETDVLLIPELCYLTGLTDAIRKNFKIMKDLAEVTQVVPEKRRQVIRAFVKDIEKTPLANELLNYWGLSIDQDLIKIKGRLLPPELIEFGGGKNCKVNEKADWGRAATTNPLLRTPSLTRWFICCTERDQRIAEEFVKMLKRVGSVMRLDVANPQRAALKNDSSQSYIQELRKAIAAGPDMVVCIVPSQRQDRYSAIKKLCCVECPVRSQVIVTKTISDERKVKAVAEKIAIQMSCKMGGAPWALNIPFSDVMICGIDVFHAGPGQSKAGSVAGFVASLDKALTVWHSSVAVQGPNQELIDLLKVCFVSALKAYCQKRGSYPDRIFIYRDGVGDGQLNQVTQYEVKQLKDAFKLIDVNYQPAMTFVVVQKRINTRVMELKGTKLDNPLPGTVVDSSVTRKHWYDFYLVPQTARQGTVTPTHYVVLHDDIALKADHLQRLSYKLCHLYYNWPGTIRVPAPCQYAHKLAYLIGQNIQGQPSPQLAETLYYL